MKRLILGTALAFLITGALAETRPLNGAIGNDAQTAPLSGNPAMTGDQLSPQHEARFHRGLQVRSLPEGVTIGDPCWIVVPAIAESKGGFVYSCDR